MEHSRFLGLLTLIMLSACSPPNAVETNQVPIIKILAPKPGSPVTVGRAVPVLVSAADSDGSVSGVYLEVDEEQVATLEDATGDGSYAGEFTPSLIGNQLLIAVASDDDGAQSRYVVNVVGLAAEELPVEEPPAQEPPNAIDSFTIIVIPDTQNMIAIPQNTMVDQMTHWIVSQAEALSIRFVTHVGDVVNDARDSDEWVRADGALDRLDGVFPYSIAVGDHEYAREENMASSTANYVSYFGPQRYSDYEWYGDSGPGGKNHYQFFDAGGRTFLHIALEWEAPGPASDSATPLGWARSIIENHPELPTIITTHAYIWDQPGAEGRFPESELEGFIEDSEGERSYPGTSGAGIFDALVEPYPQVFMVLNGHYHKAPDGSTEEGEFHQVSENAAGLEVYEMLSDYQAYPNGGQGYLRIIEFIPEGGDNGLDRIAVQTYSPVLDHFQTDARSQFHFDLSFEERWPWD
ncbi:MAG: Ig-like domain-containing protein [Trueperaceae bacterium]